MHNIDTVFFDLDGTLSDPKPGITGSIQYALEKLNIAAPSQDELTWCIGPPLRASFVALLGGEEHADRGVDLYRERFGTVGLFENTLYDGIVPVLEALHGSGRTLYVATSKPHVFADRIIDHFGLRPYFTRVFGSELDGTRADKSELLRYALDETATDPARAIMIGDRKHDVIGAANNGMAAIGAVYGYGGRAELVEAGAKHLVMSPEEITELID